MPEPPTTSPPGDQPEHLDLTREPAGDADQLDLTAEPSETALGTSLVRFAVEPYNPAEDREKVRGRIALGLVVLLAVLILLSFVSLWFGLTTSADLKSILELVFTPVVALVGSATGFYFGGRTGK